MKCSTAARIALIIGCVVFGVCSKDPAKDCIWEDQIVKNDHVKSWEIQAEPHRHKIRDRDKAVNQIERLLRDLSNDPDSGVQFVEGSRWMSIFHEQAFMVSTRHGHPLHPEERQKQACPFPWKGLAYLRLRQYKVLVPAGAYIPTAMPGQADLTFKMKKLDPDVGPGSLQLPEGVAGAKLTAKLENDVHCDHQRVTMSPLYKPVSQSLNISRIAGVKQYYPNLAQVALLDENEQLPFMHDVHRAKIMWVVLFNGVIGEANLVIKYNTTLQDAVAGARPKNGEVSLRIRREVAEATGTTGDEGRRALYAALDTVGRAMQVFRDAGWDGKTPAVQPDKSSIVQQHPKAAYSPGSGDNASGRTGLALPRPLLDGKPSSSSAAAAAMPAVSQAHAAAVRQQQASQLSLWLTQPFGQLRGALQPLLPLLPLLPGSRHTADQQQGGEKDRWKDEGCCCGACEARDNNDEEEDHDDVDQQEWPGQGTPAGARQVAAARSTGTGTAGTAEAYMVW